ncbi:MAG: serine/threonine protein kinase, partial [Polyangiaceae bacterium]
MIVRHGGSVRGSTPPEWPVPGACLDRYELLLHIAQGGMARLWLAQQHGKHGFGRLVALKTILPALATEAGFRAMFLDEARVASTIRHENVAQVLDLGEEEGILFSVMEWLDGEALVHLNRALADADAPPLPVALLLRIVADACAGLHAAHELVDADGSPLQVVHRDVSPHNLLVEFRGTTKVIDFGIAMARNRVSQDTSAGLIKGKLAYMAPEQAMGEAVDRRADIWGVGATMYRFLTGCVPFPASDPISMLRIIASGKPPPPLPDFVPEPVRRVVDKALAVRRDDRFGTAAEMQQALQDAMKAANEVATPSDVGAFMEKHLGGARAVRASEIEEALRDSRSRMKSATPVSNRPESRRPDFSDAPTAVEGLPRGIPPSEPQLAAADGEEASTAARQSLPDDAPAQARASGRFPRPSFSVEAEDPDDGADVRLTIPQPKASLASFGVLDGRLATLAFYLRTPSGRFRRAVSLLGPVLAAAGALALAVAWLGP